MKDGNKLPLKKQEEIAKRLKDLRTSAGYTQDDIAEKIKTTTKTYREWEVGKYGKCDTFYYPAIGYDNLLLISEVYHVSTDYLLCNSNCTSVDNHYISQKTGLSEKAISVLKEWNRIPIEIGSKYNWARNSLQTLNNLLAQGTTFAHNVLLPIADYIIYRSKYETETLGAKDNLDKYRLALFTATDGLSECIKNIYLSEKPIYGLSEYIKNTYFVKNPKKEAPDTN